MINKQIPYTFVVHVGDLQTVRMTDLLWLEYCIQVLHGDDSFGNLGLGFNGRIEKRFQIRNKKIFDCNSFMFIKHCRLNDDMVKELLTSSLMKYLRVKSFWESRKVRLRNCLLSLPFFHSVASNSSEIVTSNK